jgi:hypothetical protein
MAIVKRSGGYGVVVYLNAPSSRAFQPIGGIRKGRRTRTDLASFSLQNGAGWSRIGWGCRTRKDTISGRSYGVWRPLVSTRSSISTQMGCA